jgi:ketosteroid isomerase-like protein
MRNLIAEQPVVMAVLLGAVAVAALFGWLQTGKREALVVGIVFVVLIPISWAVSVRWVTAREQIREAIYATADAVKRNDFDAAVSVIDPSNARLVAAAKGDLARFRFTDARVNKFRSVELIQGSEPPEAEADLSVSVLVSDAGGQFSDYRVVRRLILRFRKSDSGRWYVYGYNHMPVAGQPDAYSPGPISDAVSAPAVGFGPVAGSGPVAGLALEPEFWPAPGQAS